MPNRRPPLAFVLDTASFVSAAGVPIGLIYLGRALACLYLRSGETSPRRDYRAGPGEDGRHASDWGWDHASLVDRDDKGCACLARAVDLRSADVWICAQPFLESAVN